MVPKLSLLSVRLAGFQLRCRQDRLYVMCLQAVTGLLVVCILGSAAAAPFDTGTGLLPIGMAFIMRLTAPACVSLARSSA